VPEETAAAVGEVRGKGIDVAFEALGTLTSQGVLALVGLREKEFGFNPTPMVFAENTAVACIAYRPDELRAAHRATAGAPSYRRVP
jgi:hypothetical protein